MKHIPSMAWMVPDNSPSMEASPNMMWNPNLSEFFLNRICEQVDRGINLSRGFKECYLKSVCNDVKDFIGITVTPCWVYNHIRKCKAKWTTVCKIKKLVRVCNTPEFITNSKCPLCNPSQSQNHCCDLHNVVDTTVIAINSK
jgi:hypothetical protein